MGENYGPSLLMALAGGFVGETSVHQVEKRTGTLRREFRR